jgi:hypothetical protein
MAYYKDQGSRIYTVHLDGRQIDRFDMRSYSFAGARTCLRGGTFKSSAFGLLRTMQPGIQCQPYFNNMRYLLLERDNLSSRSLGILLEQKQSLVISK